MNIEALDDNNHFAEKADRVYKANQQGQVKRAVRR